MFRMKNRVSGKYILFSYYLGKICQIQITNLKTSESWTLL